MLEQLELLLELQERDADLAELSREGELLPLRLDEFESERERVRAVEQEKRLALEAAKKERQHRENELEDATIRLNELKAKQLVIKTNAEYAALTHEIGFAQHDISDLEDGVLKLLEETEELTADAERAGVEADEAELRITESVRELQARLDKLNDELAVKKDERLRIAKRVDASLLRRYEGILRSKGDCALAQIADGACSGCYKSLPPQTIIEVKRATGFTECDGCGRLLYWQRGKDVG
ncbi:MAG: C4-type zinc ribbon domain-containing protein [Candidatus Eisenbacteria bacterium]|nr:C4-type zinc ribbon domain-containing protein [Candidatus Eisenbacteria bacterium]